MSAITPGPNFWKVVHHSINHSRKRATIFVCGLLTGSIIHCTLGILGVSAILASCEWCLMAMQILGGTYILWYGAKLVLGKNISNDHGRLVEEQGALFKVWSDGVMTNLSNPKSILFYASLFTIVIAPDMPLINVLLHLVSLLVTVFLTNCAIAYLLSIARVRSLFHRFHDKVSKVVGVMLMLAGIRIALQKRA